LANPFSLTREKPFVKELTLFPSHTINGCMKTKKLIIGFSLLLLYTACVIPFDVIFNFSEKSPSQANTTLQPIQEQTTDFRIGDQPEPTYSSTDPFAKADGALFAGEVDRAQIEYQTLYMESIDDETSARALYGLGRSYLLGRQYYPAIDAFNLLLGQHPDTNYQAPTYFQLGQSYEAIDEKQQAIIAYSRYVELQPGLIGAFIYKKIGDIAFSAGQYNDAIRNYQSALVIDPSYQPNTINLQIGKAYEGLEDFTTAIQYYKGVYEAAQDEFTPATANLLAGQAYLKLGQNNDAYTHFLDSVIKYPKAYDSFTALTILINQGVPVDNYLRGIVDYYAGAYEGAIRALENYLDSNPDNNDGSAYFFLGLSYFFTGNAEAAIEAYDQVINNYPGNIFWPDAWDERAYIEWDLQNNPQKAAETYLTFANRAPTSPDAPGFLYEAGRILEIEGDLEGAAVIWQRMMNDYPSAQRSYRALFLAAIQYYRLERYNDALSVFQRALVLAASPDEKARAYLWVGKTYRALGDEENAMNAWKLGEIADPTDYYSIRNSEIQQGLPPYQITGDYDLGYDLSLEQGEAEQWMRTTFSLPADTDLNSLAEMTNHPAIEKLNGFWELGLYMEATEQADVLREEYQTDPVNTYRLMNYLIEKHLYQPAIHASRNILNLAGLDDLSTLSAPIYFTHIRFGAYFREITVRAANEFGINPLLMFSLIRQESLFNPFIFSSAGASGLAQFIPSTGADVAARLGWPPGYQQEDLTRAVVSARFGSEYLRWLKDDLFDGNIQYALASYNWGLGNVNSNLQAINSDDPDLFLEALRAEEAQNYLMQIGEFLNIYKLVYSRPQ
jgi:soluble lytic murein transglycosylase